MASLVTLVLAVTVTGTVVYLRGDFRAAPGPSVAHVPEDPCASVEGSSFDDLDARPEFASVRNVETSCSWAVGNGDIPESTLRVEYAVPDEARRAELAEERGGEPVTEADELYQDAHEYYSEPVLEHQEAFSERERPESYGDESALVFLEYGDPELDYPQPTVSAALVIRDGERVTSVSLSSYTGELEFTQAEHVITDLVDDVPWQE
ncbi:hypothetical protein EFW17_19230 [Halostreptopolyspora alba]|uniref:DUF3558 domain-containing protein n=2 Tax=Halostreptopolyspora alba TaxID=2487137 RepID=A0A3N0E3M4_9ACTN|nr:hypothetical protein EFW17_19230 [Nocardiopsaceae bacterium YIM 96095]